MTVMKTIRGSVITAAAAAMLAGCTAPTTSTLADVAADPVTTDPAMSRRDWPQSTALYANGSVVADPTLVTFVPRDDLESRWQYYAADVGSFVANAVLLPVALFRTPANSDVVYGGYVVAPSHFAVPTLPPATDAAVEGTAVEPTPPLPATTQPVESERGFVEPVAPPTEPEDLPPAPSTATPPAPVVPPAAPTPPAPVEPAPTPQSLIEATTPQVPATATPAPTPPAPTPPAAPTTAPAAPMSK